MTPEPTDALMPCPFCGCKAVASINKDESLWSHDVVDWTRVHCTNDECNAQTEATCEGYEPSAVEVWNRRTPQPAPAPLSDDVVKDAERYRWLFGARTASQVTSVSETVFKPLLQDEVLSHLQGFYMSKADVDALVDAALAAQGGKA